ncbi:MAG: aminoacyl-tRNA hydrolase [Christensenellales bacterium]|jgi:PTH1 family peptidyl-tRNA hydrolase
MYVVVGLGNPGVKYARTHHNAGFDVVELLAAKWGVALNKRKCKALLGEGTFRGERVVLAQPQTYMNLSGQSVVELVNWYKIEPANLIVVYDDVDIPLANLRVREKGSAGTHNGMRSILYLLGTDAFPRVRVGIGGAPDGWELADYVLSGFRTKEETEDAYLAYQKAGELIEILISEGCAKAQQAASEFNKALRQEKV